MRFESTYGLGDLVEYKRDGKVTYAFVTEVMFKPDVDYGKKASTPAYKVEGNDKEIQEDTIDALLERKVPGTHYAK